MDSIRFAKNAAKIIRESAPPRFSHHQEMEEYTAHYMEVMRELAQLASGGSEILSQAEIEELKPKTRKKNGG